MQKLLFLLVIITVFMARNTCAYAQDVVYPVAGDQGTTELNYGGEYSGLNYTLKELPASCILVSNPEGDYFYSTAVQGFVMVMNRNSKWLWAVHHLKIPDGIRNYKVLQHDNFLFVIGGTIANNFINKTIWSVYVKDGLDTLEWRRAGLLPEEVNTINDISNFYADGDDTGITMKFISGTAATVFYGKFSGNNIVFNK
ncbi:MAG: hypothetical protein DKM50_01805 [Candidatus Margulisiibacteriota bacterium]|nr:MAG: hypothetical protein A2X43_13340 [Candidatus Margulisbacteria bacterium GWD2_39_127]OGI04759.1 MAG: hypothetical protein A2X42_10655 [Candidatus Margulisbacteria bacterium GWF2_38_17]OGI05704.1 MAG: hypothetical protein A2X41_03240 [Candidatus Margulisbacteria bacterium GWE2_39_32]PZM83638.1 MAG: hypothetical protein DKM50_01805 [Candidatus Margulisiibacteriota bacterium]HAR62056.1 hypothetical protein [Candidatus Margulisiibacteriota bacterium]